MRSMCSDRSTARPRWPRAHQRHKRPPGAAAQIGHQPRPIELPLEHGLVELEQTVEREVVVVVVRDVRRVDVVPRARATRPAEVATWGDRIEA